MMDSPPLGNDDTLDGDSEVSRVRGALPLRAGAPIGRYLAVERLAAGGMGVVWSAYDPELDRKVAIKLLLADGGGSVGRARLLREAQAMARLSHPNVVTVHDVGTFGEAVFVAMELVQGWTLGAWLLRSPRRWTDVLEVLLAAGRGLVEAHDAGLVHRDVKPDNIMIGADGRVRVMDFGLARDGRAVEASPDELSRAPSRTGVDITLAGSVVGTPAYMPPEQWAGELPDARGDQFSFCVTCWEALYGAPPFRGDSLVELAAQINDGRLHAPPPSSPIPRWVGRVLARGLSTRADARFASMRELLGALQAGRRRARLRTLGVAGLGVALLGAALVTRGVLVRRDELRACAEQGAAIAQLWPGAQGDARADIAAAFVATGLGYADDTLARTQTRLDLYAAELGEAVGTQCEAALDGPSPTSAPMRACLDERRSALQALVDIFRDADSTTLQRASSSALGLPRIVDCLDPALAMRRRSPDDEALAREVAGVRQRLEAANVHDRAGRFALALEQAEQAVASAEALGWPPLVAEAHARRGNVALSTGDYPRAERDLVLAFTGATAAADDEVAAVTASVLVDLVGAVDGRHAEGMIWAHVAQALLERLGETETLHGANLRADLGNLLYARGEPALAEQEHRAALQLHVALLGEANFMVAHGHARLGADAIAAGHAAEALEHYGRAIALFESLLGPDHPDLADYLNGLGAAHRALGHDSEAERAFQRAVDLLQRALGPDAVAVAQAISNVALVQLERGDAADARPHLERALAILEHTLGPEHVDLSTVLVNLGIVYERLGRLGDAERVTTRALAIREAVLGADHPAVARCLTRLAAVHVARQRDAQAVALLERAVRILTTHDVPAADVGEAELLLGAALWTSGGDRARAIASVESSRLRFAAEPEAQADNLAQAQSWLREHPRAR